VEQIVHFVKNDGDASEIELPKSQEAGQVVYTLGSGDYKFEVR